MTQQNPDFESVEYHLVYNELINAARRRGIVTYQELAHVVGLPLEGNYMGKRIGELLGTVSENEVRHNRPMLSAIAVTTGGRPGGGFFTWARQLNLLQSEHKADEEAFWEQQQKQIYATWQQKFHKG
ncbi:MAG: hypothetical protein JNL42_03140 [Anaerolineae bacterium]|nr:hypothetical protein [Anaerolineae bacterium]